MPRTDNFCAVVIDDNPVPTPTNPLGVKGILEKGNPRLAETIRAAVKKKQLRRSQIGPRCGGAPAARLPRGSVWKFK